MTTVYLVTDGCYSDYRVCGVYDTKEKAEHAQALFYADDVEEYELNAIPDVPPGMFGWRVDMQRDGTATAHREPAPIDDGEKRFLMPCTFSPKGMTGSCYAVDEWHAIKIINERRIAALAMDTWIEDWATWHMRKTK